VQVEVTDANGNLATTNAVSFEVLPAMNPSPSSAQQPTPTPTPNKIPADFTPVIVIATLVGAAVVLGLLIFLAKSRGEK
jgi:hypothetical protein